jgi:hypothetical protein
MKNIQAFPGKQKALMIKSEHLDIANEYEIEQNGMTLRDYFAAKAMVGLMAMERAEQYIGEDGLEMDYDEDGSVGTLFVHTDQMAQEAYMIADMMLKARGE